LTALPLRDSNQHTAVNNHSPGGSWTVWVVLFAILLGSFVRWAALGPMNDMLHYDEAYNGMDALSLLHSPRLTPFLPGNYGREAGWCYVLVPFVALFGATPFALRLAATMTGVLTLAASCRLGREVLGARGGIWVAAALSLLYWHVHLSHLALRAILFPLLGALAFAFLLAAFRSGRTLYWVLGGVGIGLLAYTYFSAYAWILYALLCLGAILLLGRRRRQGALFALVAIAILVLPMALYGLQNAGTTLDRPGTVAVLNPQGIERNVHLWSRAWFQEGDTNAEFNLPGRPILDPYLGALFVLGLVGLPFVARRRWYSAWTLGLGVLALLPSLFSNFAPHFLRAAGCTVPIAIIAGAGAVTIEKGLRRLLDWRFVSLLPLLLLALAGVQTYRDFHLRWLQDPELFVFMEQHVNRAINFVKDSAPAGTPVYFSPLAPTHPVLVFRAADLAPRRIEAFDSHNCLVVPEQLTVYVSLTMYEPGFEEHLSRWADVGTLATFRSRPQGGPQSSVFLATPRWPSDLDDTPVTAKFADTIALYPAGSLPPSIPAGGTMPVDLAWRALAPLDQAYSAFVHLYGDPTPYEGGSMWSQGDNQLCPSHPSWTWKTEELIVQRFELPVPADIPPGRYTVAVGVYASANGARLPITAPSSRPGDYAAVQEVEIIPAETNP